MTAAVDPLALAAVEPIESGMVVGLGTGRAAARAIVALAARTASSGLDITCVATSLASARQGAELGLKVLDASTVAQVDYLFDGADEVDRGLCMTKGGGGAMTRERIIAAAVRRTPGTARRVYLIDASKRVRSLGERMPLPVEVIPMALAGVRKRLELLGLTPTVRPSKEKPADPFITDNGNLVLDCAVRWSDLERRGIASPRVLAQALDGMAGLVDHGIFADEADVVLVEASMGATSGPIERLERR